MIVSIPPYVRMNEFSTMIINNSGGLVVVIVV